MDLIYVMALTSLGQRCPLSHALHTYLFSSQLCQTSVDYPWFPGEESKAQSLIIAQGHTISYAAVVTRTVAFGFSIDHYSLT